MTSDSARPNRNPLYERWRWQVFGITWLAYAGFYMTRKSFSVAKIELSGEDSMGLSIGQMAWIDTAYLTAYAIGQFVWGITGDKFGTRKVILCGMMASVITAFLMGASTLTVALGVLFCIQGICQSTGWAPLAKNIGHFFSQKERGRVMGWWCTNYALGGVIASAYAGWAADLYGWRFAFWVPAVTLLFIWFLFIIFQRNRPEDVGLPPIEEYHGEPAADLTEEGMEEGSWRLILHVMKDPMVLLLSIVYFFLKPTRYLILLWSPMYMNERLGTGMAASGILGGMFELAGPLGVLAGGYISDKLFSARRMPPSIIGLFLVAVMLFFFDDLPATGLSLGLGLFFLGFVLHIPESLVSATSALDFGTKQGASTASGMVNGFGSIGAIFGGALPGIVKAYQGEGHDIWGIVFLSLSIMILISALLLLPKWNAVPKTKSPKK